MSHRSNPLRPALLVAVFSAALILGGCGSSGDDTSTDTTATSEEAGTADDSGAIEGDGGGSCPDQTQVAAAVSADVELSPGSNPVDGCNYYGKEGTPDAEVSVNVLIEQPTAQTIDDVERNLPVDRVEGVGDAAWETVTPGGIVQFGAFEDDRYVTVTIAGASDDVAMGRSVYELVS